MSYGNEQSPWLQHSMVVQVALLRAMGENRQDQYYHYQSLVEALHLKEDHSKQRLHFT